METIWDETFDPSEYREKELKIPTYEPSPEARYVDFERLYENALKDGRFGVLKELLVLMDQSDFTLERQKAILLFRLGIYKEQWKR